MKIPDTTWIVIPAYNEEKHIQTVLRKVKSIHKNIVVVDDGSKDATPKKALAEKIYVLTHTINLGKGAAVRDGCDFVLKKNAKQIILMDADGQHNPKDIPRFIKALKNKDIIFGYRKLNKNMPAIMRFGNWFINTISMLLYKINLKDTQSGYRAMTAEAYRKVRWKSNDYSMESEMIANAGIKKLKYDQIPIETIYHDKYKGTNPLHGIKIVLDMIIWKIKGMQKNT